MTEFSPARCSLPLCLEVKQGNERSWVGFTEAAFKPLGTSIPKELLSPEITSELMSELQEDIPSKTWTLSKVHKHLLSTIFRQPLCCSQNNLVLQLMSSRKQKDWGQQKVDWAWGPMETANASSRSSGGKDTGCMESNDSVRQLKPFPVQLQSEFFQLWVLLQRRSTFHCTWTRILPGLDHYKCGLWCCQMQCWKKVPLHRQTVGLLEVRCNLRLDRSKCLLLVYQGNWSQEKQAYFKNLLTNFRSWEKFAFNSFVFKLRS